MRNVKLWCGKMSHWKFTDYEHYYKDPKVHPYFNAYNCIRYDVYYDVQQSLDIAVELLMHPFDNNSVTVADFLTDLYNILDKRIPKCNTLAILAPPNSGKNDFFDAVAAFFYKLRHTRHCQ